jgi:hypothetical protein
VRRLLIVQQYAWIVIGIGLVLLSIYVARQNDQDEIRDVRVLALEANAATENLRVQQQFVRGKVCAETGDQRTACRALFERLARNVSRRQLYRLACTVLWQVRRDPSVRRWRAGLKCPPPTALSSP